MKNYNPNVLTTESQNRAILAYLKSGKRITQLVALELFGCMRLPSRIHDIKKAGVAIKDQFITLANNKRVKEYWL
jgi:hypothetical protein